MTLAELLTSPDLASKLKYGSKVDIACSFCGKLKVMPRCRILEYARTGVEMSFCSAACKNKHRAKDGTIFVNGVPHRKCFKCGVLFPFFRLRLFEGENLCRPCKPLTQKEAFAALKSKAKYSGYAWALTEPEFEVFWQQPCFYCGDLIATVGLDRVDSSKGYSADNIVPCCKVCNRGKNDQTASDFLARCARVALKAGKENHVQDHLYCSGLV